MTKKAEQAKALFKEGFSCSQAVFKPFAVEAGLEQEKALKLSQVLGGGLAHMGMLCGAVSGALLVISLHFGRSRADDLASKELTYELAQEFCRRFAGRHGSINCSDLLGCSLKTPQGRELASEKKLFEKYCAVYVEDACRLLEKIMNEGRRKKARPRAKKIVKPGGRRTLR